MPQSLQAKGTPLQESQEPNVVDMSDGLWKLNRELQKGHDRMSLQSFKFCIVFSSNIISDIVKLLKSAKTI